MEDFSWKGSELLHQRVYRAIADAIDSATLQPGERLPPERELSARFAVSRATLRRALSELATDGLVESRQGQGTFVATDAFGPAVGEAPNVLSSFTALGASRGLAATAVVLDAHCAPADLDEADLFGIAPGADLFVLERLRLLDGLPVGIDRNRVPLLRAPGLPDVDFSTASLYEVLSQNAAGPTRADYTVCALAANARQADLLQVAVGSPILSTTTTSFDGTGSVVEIGEMLYRGDRYRFRTTLTTQPGSRMPDSKASENRQP